MINGKQRAKLKSYAHDFKPVINIGKSSINENLISAIDEALTARELIKVKILNNNLDDDEEIIKTIIENLDAEFISHIGSIFTIYRKSEENKFNL